MSPAALRILLASSSSWWLRSAWDFGSSAGPGPLAFADGPNGGARGLSRRNPTGVPPAALAQASPVERGAYLAR